ncbi:hypothetical protein EYF80_029235 [Liparis tanakae]|uniref:Uncharacterized protein n=1 Tax=Liparis tanakae TaxID=230148 RepID=A0A4Z2H6K1_9TELE|nr:hypothetical protein EYF80_029235 [Liparis tanakae]
MPVWSTVNMSGTPPLAASGLRLVPKTPETHRLGFWRRSVQRSETLRDVTGTESALMKLSGYHIALPERRARVHRNATLPPAAAPVSLPIGEKPLK